MKHIWSIDDQVRFATHEFISKAWITQGIAWQVECKFAFLMERFQKGIIQPDEFLYEVKPLIGVLTRMINDAAASKKATLAEQPQAAVVEVHAVAEPIVEPKAKPLRKPKLPQPGVPIGVEPINRQARRKAAKAA